MGSSRQPSMSVPAEELRPGTIARALLAGVAALIAAYALTGILAQATQNARLFGLVRMFDLDGERNIPALYSTCLFLLCGILFLLVGRATVATNTPAWAWWLLGAVFLLFGVDEFVGIHEELTEPVRNAFKLSGVFYYAWVVPYAIAGVILALFLIRTFIELPAGLKGWFIVSGALLVVGTIAFEMIGGWLFEASGRQRGLLNAVLVAVEETCEMAGLIVLIYALLRLLGERFGGFSLVVPAPDRDTGADDPVTEAES